MRRLDRPIADRSTLARVGSADTITIPVVVQRKGGSPPPAWFATANAAIDTVDSASGLVGASDPAHGGTPTESGATEGVSNAGGGGTVSGKGGLAIRAGDRCVSWLPLYHDMGLVGCCLTPALVQGSVDFFASTSFARRPLLWLKLFSEQGVTLPVLGSLTELPEVLAMSDRILVMREGRETGVFARAEATQERLLAAAMGQAEAPAESA